MFLGFILAKATIFSPFVPAEAGTQGQAQRSLQEWAPRDQTRPRGRTENVFRPALTIWFLVKNRGGYIHTDVAPCLIFALCGANEFLLVTGKGWLCCRGNRGRRFRLPSSWPSRPRWRTRMIWPR